MEILLAILLGISLSAACGFRVFVPMFIASLAAYCGYLDLGDGFEWLGSRAALIAFGVATVLETGAYYIPVIDNVLDAAAAPLAAVAGTLLTAALVTDMSPFLQWSLAIIAGGGSASIIHAGTAALRAVVTPGTAGMGNSALSTGEAAASGGLSLLALISPVVAIIFVIIVLWLVIRTIRKFLAARRRRTTLPSSTPSH